MTPDQILAIQEELSTIKDAVTLIDFAQAKINKILSEYAADNRK